MSNAAETPDDDGTPTLGESLSIARERARYTQADMAALVGVSKRTITNWETGSTVPDIREYLAYARATGARWLLDLAGQNWK